MWQQYPNKIPEELRGRTIYAWASVAGGRACQGVPFLDCRADKPYVYGCILHDVDVNEPVAFVQVNPEH